MPFLIDNSVLTWNVHLIRCYKNRLHGAKYPHLKATGTFSIKFWCPQIFSNVPNFLEGRGPWAPKLKFLAWTLNPNTILCNWPVKWCFLFQNNPKNQDLSYEGSRSLRLFWNGTPPPAHQTCCMSSLGGLYSTSLRRAFHYHRFFVSVVLNPSIPADQQRYHCNQCRSWWDGS